MITRAEIEKLGALHVAEPAMLSLYLAEPPPADLAARAGELIPRGRPPLLTHPP